MLRELRYASLCLLLAGVQVATAGDGAPAAASSAAAPVTPPAAVPDLPGPGPSITPPPPRTQPPPGAPEGPGSVAAEQAAAIEENPDWAVTLQRIAGSVVSIDVDQTRAFDTEWNNSAQATGFVVDAERGLILTNRHVVTPGPVTAEATFLNREEVQLYPVYRDPVHDFGFYRYDPQKLRFIKPRALALYPEGAQIGREIRVVGNNAGEQLSILAGTLARLDRDAPEYGVTKYNDFNTFYLQAASGTSGGSSGSPVIDIRGRVVALNAGGANGAASSFYLPLGRVRRVLNLIQQGKPVSRGTLYTVFNYMPYDELERLGLDAGTEAAVRKDFPRYTGMLVVTEVLPGSPSEKVLQPGDILLRLNGRYMAQFEPLEEVLDSSVGSDVELELERGGKLVSAKLPVGDLHAITPSAYAEFGDSVVNTLSYQQARHFNVPARGVYVANPGYVFGAATIPRGAVILNLNGNRTDTLQQFETGIAQLGNGDHATVRYLTIDDPNNTDLKVVRMDRLWFPAHHCDRDDTRGLWDCRDLTAGPAPKPVPVSSTAFPHFTDPRMNALAPSLAMVTFDMPYSVSGITERNYHGTGLVVDAERGLVVVDRNTVPVSVGDVTVTFAGTVQVPGRVVYVHPLHNYAVVAYDPRLIGKTPARARSRGATVGGGARSRQPDALAQHADRGHRAARAAAVAHHALPRRQHRNHPAGDPTQRIRRRADRQERQRARHLVELRLRERPRDRPGHPRGTDRTGRRHDRPRAYQPAAALARCRARCATARERPADRPVGCLDTTSCPTHPHAPSGAHGGTAGRRLGCRRTPATGRPAARHR